MGCERFLGSPPLLAAGAWSQPIFLKYQSLSLGQLAPLASPSCHSLSAHTPWWKMKARSCLKELWISSQFMAVLFWGVTPFWAFQANHWSALFISAFGRRSLPEASSIHFTP